MFILDPDTNTVSLTLYRYLCENIVGTKNHVKTIRLLNTIRDNGTSTESEASITSGSFGEGLEMRGSDLDMMASSKFIEVYADEKTTHNSMLTYYKMETDDVKPGFTQLLSETNGKKALFQFCEELNGKHFLSSTLFKQFHSYNIDGAIIHGPCVSDKNGILDQCLCLHCKTWISQASQWISRSNNAWPSYNVKQNQLSNFHVSMWMDHFEPYTLHAIEVVKTLNSKLLRWSNDMMSVNVKKKTCLYKRRVHQIVYCDKSSLKYFYIYYMSLWCARFAQTIPLTNTRSSNKHQYKQYNSCFCILLQNIHHDAVSGWLMLASVFYKAKQYDKALHIIIYIITKCTPEKLYSFMDMSDTHYQMLKLKSIQEKTIVRLWKIKRVDVMKFERNSWLIPNELQI
ncbi:unnamed protein product [Mytilus coruscus]|uniref:Uncharacterized protein n=1 Tax=Mytilus coruscus TaxID=42192 RepID=A0A6J8DGE3_MYTCO|nr:unnamed protein product [Mytilus coruscus]